MKGHCEICETEIDIQMCCSSANADCGWCKQAVINNTKIRRLTPLECFRAMDFNEDFKWNVSDSQAYKQAGNSICVGVLAKIINNLNF